MGREEDGEAGGKGEMGTKKRRMDEISVSLRLLCLQLQHILLLRDESSDTNGFKPCYYIHWILFQSPLKQANGALGLSWLFHWLIYVCYQWVIPCEK